MYRAVSLVGGLGVMVWLSLGTGPALAAPGATAARTSLSSTASCAGRNPYAVSAATDQICGLIVSPMTGVTTLSDGGKAYHYTVGNQSVEQLVPPSTPPSGFNPLTASSLQLALDGYPPKPPAATPAQLQSWVQSIDHSHSVAPTSFLVSDPNAMLGGGNSDNWSGYSDTSSSNTAYSSSDATFNEPTIGASTCLQNSEATWSGLGGAAGGDDGLAQDGTMIGQGSGNAYEENQAFWELLPNSATFVNLIATAGQPFRAYTKFLGYGASSPWPASFQFYLVNKYTGASYDYIDTTPGSPGQWPDGTWHNYYDGSAADYIGEAPLSNGVIQPLTNFQSFGFSSAYTNGEGIKTLPWYQWNLNNASDTYLLVTDGTLGTTSFGLTWEACQERSGDEKWSLVVGNVGDYRCDTPVGVRLNPGAVTTQI